MNPLIFRKGVCDPHIHIFEGKAYLYATHDAPGYEDNFHMDDWLIYSSENLIDWKQEATIHPEDFYCGALNQCWAIDAAERDGKYYLYFSTGDWGVGVAVADHPAGPFVDALGAPLVDYRQHPVGVPKWDPHVFIDDDGEAYLIVGTCRQEKPWDCYLIGRLEHDMIHLAEPLRRMEYINNPWPEDKPSVHKWGGRYYLTHSSYYAVADNVYGPYTYMGNSGCNIDHGTYFTYHNQTYFATGGMDNTNRYLRASYLAPCHYRENGEIVVDQQIMEYGCGQYDAVWEKIYTSWYFESTKECKKELSDGKFATALENGEYLGFPEIANVEADTNMQIFGQGDGRIFIRENTPEGKIIGTCDLGKEKGVYECVLECSHGKKNLYLEAEGSAELEWFSLTNGKKRSCIEPVFSRVGRGACVKFDRNGTNHQVLQNMELRGAFVDALADGGAGGKGRITVPYYCTGEPVTLQVLINGEKQSEMVFPVTGEPHLGETPALLQAEVVLLPGLNRICLASEEYQNGCLAIDHVIVEAESDSVDRRKTAPFKVYTAANGEINPKGNGCWDGFPQWETDPFAYSGRIVKLLEKPEDSLTIHEVNGGDGGSFTLEIHYCRGEAGNSSYEIQVNGETPRAAEFPETGGFTTGKMEAFQMGITLKPGTDNEIILRKTGKKDRGIYVDAVTVLSEA